MSVDEMAYNIAPTFLIHIKRKYSPAILVSFAPEFRGQISTRQRWWINTFLHKGESNQY